MGWLRRLLGRLRPRRGPDGEGAEQELPPNLGAGARYDMAYLGDDMRDVVSGWQFRATLYLDTPLRVLKHHDAFSPGADPPPCVTRKMSEGIWAARLKTWRCIRRRRRMPCCWRSRASGRRSWRRSAWRADRPETEARHSWIG